MIPAEAFYQNFNAAFGAPADLVRKGRRGAKWKWVAAGHEIELSFAVDRKAAGIPDAPGAFWPLLSWQGPRYGARDDGTVSYYQYATEADITEIQSMRRAVVQKVVSRAQPNKLLSVYVEGLDTPLRPNHPQVGLFYFDERDAAAWGGWFGARIAAWRERFAAAPETLESYCRRVLWPR